MSIQEQLHQLLAVQALPSCNTAAGPSTAEDSSGHPRSTLLCKAVPGGKNHTTAWQGRNLSCPAAEWDGAQGLYNPLWKVLAEDAPQHSSRPSCHFQHKANTLCLPHLKLPTALPARAFG